MSSRFGYYLNIKLGIFFLLDQQKLSTSLKHQKKHQTIENFIIGQNINFNYHYSNFSSANLVYFYVLHKVQQAQGDYSEYKTLFVQNKQLNIFFSFFYSICVFYIPKMDNFQCLDWFVKVSVLKYFFLQQLFQEQVEHLISF